MVPSSDLPATTKLKAILEVITNVIVVLFAIVAIGVLVKNYFVPNGKKISVAISKGTVFPAIAGVEYSQNTKTLILALNVDCRYCSRSVPFYNSLAQSQRQQNANKINIVAAFINNDAMLVKSYAEQKQLLVQAISGIDLDELGVHMTPTLILVDSAGKVLDSWRGELQPDGEREVFSALDLPYRPKAGSTATAANVTKTADMFDEQKGLSIGPRIESENDPAHFVEVFDVNSKGDVYIAHDKVMYRYDREGKQKDARLLPSEFRSPFCVDDNGNIYASTAGGLSVFSPELIKVRDIALDVRFPHAFTLKLALDRKRASIYIQSYSAEPTSGGTLPPSQTCSFQPDVHSRSI